MIKLIKYEFRKMRTTLLTLLLVLAALEVVFLIGMNADNEKMYGISMGVIGFLVFGVYGYVLIAGVVGYARELSNRTGYLLFMAPVRPLSIIIGKLFATLAIAVGAVAVFGAVAYFDLDMLLTKLEVFDGPYLNMFDALLHTIGGAEFGITQILLALCYAALIVLIDMLLFISTAYLAITLAVTLLENKKGFVRGLVSVALYIGLNIGVSQLAGVLMLTNMNRRFDTVMEVLITLWPLLALYLGVSILFCWLSSVLLDKKVSL